MEEKENYRILNYIESQSSFSVNIGLSETKNKKYVLFKPVFIISSYDLKRIKYIRNKLNLSNTKILIKTKKKDYHNNYYTCNVQNKDDLYKVLLFLNKNKFLSANKRDRFEYFVDCLGLIREIGFIHETYKEEFNEIIRLKLLINKQRSNISKNRFSEKDWERKIKEHL